MSKLNLRNLIDNKDNIVVAKKILDKLEITEKDRIDILNDLKNIKSNNSIYIRTNNKNLLQLDYLPIISIKIVDYAYNVWIMNNGIRNKDYIKELLVVEISTSSITGSWSKQYNYKEILESADIKINEISKEEYENIEYIHNSIFSGTYIQSYDSATENLPNNYYPKIENTYNELYMIFPFGSNIDMTSGISKRVKLTIEENKLILKEFYNDLFGYCDHDVILYYDKNDYSILYNPEIDIKGTKKNIKIINYKMTKI